MRGSRLGKRGKNSFFDEEEQNPMQGDACGLMMAIISFYNVDINGTNTKAEELKQEQLQEVDDYGVIDEDGNVSGGFESRGKVYEDKKTGKMYVITQENEDSTSK